MPAVFDAARQNLENPPRVYDRNRSRTVARHRRLLSKRCSGRIHRSQRPGCEKPISPHPTPPSSPLCKSYEKWLKADLAAALERRLPLRRRNVFKKLRHDELIDTPLDRLLEIGTADTPQESSRIQSHRQGSQSRKDPSRSSGRTRRHASSSRSPPPDFPRNLRWPHRLSFKANTFLTIPSDIKPHRPGDAAFRTRHHHRIHGHARPLRKGRHRSLFQRDSSRFRGYALEQIAGRMAGFNVGTIISTAVHETYPGHYVQVSYVAPMAPTKLRKMMGANTNDEGWAHSLSEQMMLDLRATLSPALARKISTNHASSASANCRMPCCAMRASWLEFKCTAEK